MIEAFVFYMFALALVFSATLTVTLRHPVHAVLCLIWTFFNAAGLFLNLGAEFLAFILLVVYIGAVAVLFLFVVMMLGTQKENVRATLKRTLPVGLGVGVALLLQLAAVIWTWPAALPEVDVQPEVTNNMRALGDVLYTDYFYSFQVAGLILLVAMIGAIVLTMQKRTGTRKQNVWKQLDTERDDVLKIHNVKSGEGLS